MDFREEGDTGDGGKVDVAFNKQEFAKEVKEEGYGGGEYHYTLWAVCTFV